MNKKAWYFTLDAVMFSAIILSVIYLQLQQTSTLPQTTNNEFVAQDLLGVMSNQPITEVNATLYAVYENNITDTSFTVLEQLGQWWANDQSELASEFYRNYTQSLVRSEVGKGFFINDEGIFIESSPPPSQLSSGKRIVSGVEKERPISGAVASARATKIKKNQTAVFSFHPQGAGWNRGRVLLTKTFELPQNITISNATLIASVHTDRDLNDRLFTINNCTVPFVQADFLYWTEGDVGVKDVTSCLVGGNNTMTADLNNRNYNGHTHPGSALTVEFQSDEFLTQEVRTTEFSETIHFDKIVSTPGSGPVTGVWASLPFFIPTTATNISIQLYVKAENVTDYQSGDCWKWGGGGCQNFNNWNGRQQARNYDYQIFLNSDNAFDVDATPPPTAEYWYNITDLQPLIINGTNLITLYFNNYEDYVWGAQTMGLSEESYVQINYTLPTSTRPFGYVEVSQAQEFGGSGNRDKTIGFNFPAQAEYITGAELYIVQRYSYEVDVWADPFTPPPTLVFSSPAPRGVPSLVYIPEERLEQSSAITNYIRVRDVGSGNEVLPISKVLYTFSVPSQVGFGEVFATQAEAEADAIARLQARMGGFVDPQSINTSAQTITRVPSLWGPATIEVRTWQ